jgi:hypothetical protein
MTNRSKWFAGCHKMLRITDKVIVCVKTSKKCVDPRQTREETRERTAGAHTISAHYAGVDNSFLGGTGQASLTVLP